MKVFYLCRTGRHTSLLAAALHLGYLSGKKRLYRQLSLIRGFNQTDLKDIGNPLYVGKDSRDSYIYTIGVSNESRLMARAINDLIRLMDTTESGKWLLVDTTPYISRWTRAGLVLKKFGLGSAAKLFFYLGARNEVGELTNLTGDSGSMPEKTKNLRTDLRTGE